MRHLSPSHIYFWRLCQAFCVAQGLIIGSLPTAGLAQVVTSITSDGSLSSTVNREGSVYSIAGGTLHGPNLFHSFDQFTLGTGDIAHFSGPQSGVSNVLGRVTGGQQSVIDGLLRSDIPGADLYLLNPSGVMFGANASLDVNGSLHVTTADFLELTGGARFVASLGGSVLSSASPVAFGFLGASPQAIVVRESALQVTQGETLSLIGGDITVLGDGVSENSAAPQLGAPGGQIHLQSVAPVAGEEQLAPAQPYPAFDVSRTANAGQIRIAERALVDVSSPDGSGTVLLRGGHVQIEGATIAADTRGDVNGAPVGIDIGARTVSLGGGAQIRSMTVGAGEGGNVTVRAMDEVRLTGINEPVPPTGIVARTTGEGPAGAIRVEAPRVVLVNGAQISSTTSGTGRSGNVTVNATDEVRIEGAAPEGCLDDSGCVTIINADTLGLDDGAGSGGAVVVKAPRVILRNGGLISSSTRGTGRGGSVTVSAMDEIRLEGVFPKAVGALKGLFNVTPSGIVAVSAGAGDAGAIKVDAPRVMLVDGGVISSTTLGVGKGGDVAVRAMAEVRLEGIAPDGTPDGSPSTIGASALAQLGTKAAAGSVTVSAPSIVLADGARIDTRTLTDGSGGDLELEASDKLKVSAASISTRATGSASGGNITVLAGGVELVAGATVTAAARSANGGNIAIAAGGIVQLHDSTLTATVSGDVQSQGGNIGIEAGFVVLENSQIIAKALEGRGGAIRIIAHNAVLADPASQISASSTLGIDGTVEIEAPATDLSGTVTPLSSTLTDVTPLLQGLCLGRLTGGEHSRFSVVGRGQVPAGPTIGSPPAPKTTLQEAGTTHGSDSTPAPLRVAQAWDCRGNARHEDLVPQ